LTVQEIAAEKDGQLARYEQAIAKMGKKVEQYKDRNARLAEKVKVQADTIKALMDRQLSLECETVRGREELEKERTRRTEEGRYTSELRQVVSLQELQNK
jgi:predicted RNase H-like nuclease (RuvC/YqgF family)